MDKLLVFKLCDGKYACNTKYVDRIIKYENLTHFPSIQSTFEGLYNHEGKVLKVYNLSTRLGIESDNKTPHKKIIIVKDNNIVIGIVVDEVLEVFNYHKDVDKSSDKSDIRNRELNFKGLDFNYVEDMILVQEEIIIYIAIDKILRLEVQESEL